MSVRAWCLAWALVQVACDQVFGGLPPVDGDNIVIDPDGSFDSQDTLDPHDASIDPDVVAHYRFEQIPPIVDETGRHDGSIEGGVTTVSGMVGNAIAFSAQTPIPHVVVPDASAWDLSVGAIELWVRPINITSGNPGILARDSSGTGDGHFVLTQLGSKFFVVRLQRVTDSGTGGGVYLCSNEPPRPGQWTHIGINFGPPRIELWVDGVLATRTETIFIFSQTHTCGGPDDARSLEGNNNPWVFGALSGASMPGTTSSITDGFAGGAIDELIIWRTQRNFQL